VAIKVHRHEGSELHEAEPKNLSTISMITVASLTLFCPISLTEFRIVEPESMWDR
jgi:hypothetical protein